MGITANSKTTTAGGSSSSGDNWAMGLLFVFFPEDNSGADKPNASFSFSSSSKSLRRSNSNSPILTKTQSTLSICALLLFFPLLLFTFSTFEPSFPVSVASVKTHRRLSPEKFTTTHQRIKPNNLWVSKIWPRSAKKIETFSYDFALQKMGNLYLRGSKAMNDLLVAHVDEETNEDEFRVFLRLLFRSGITAKADTVFISSSSLASSRFESLIREETDSFLKLVQYYRELNSTSRDSVSAAGLRFEVTRFLKRGMKEMAEPLWGKRIRDNNYTESGENNENESTRLSYGSVVGFETSELDPENSLNGFLDHVPMSLKRWACYPMLLGRVRRNFKHIMLVDVRKLVLLSDPMDRVRNRSPESVLISIKQESSSSSKHGKRNPDKTQSQSQVNSAILMGGTRGIRRFSNAMLTEIVRVAMQQKKKRKSSVTESAILNQLVSNEHILKNIKLMMSVETIPEASWLSESGSDGWDRYRIVQRGNFNSEVNSIIKKRICSCEVESSVYKDC